MLRITIRDGLSILSNSTENSDFMQISQKMLLLSVKLGEKLNTVTHSQLSLQLPGSTQQLELN